MMTNASNASLPAAQLNLGLPTIVKVVGNGVTDDWASIQAAIDSATGPAIIAIPPKPDGIRISQALRMRDNITLWSLDWNQPWRCTGDAAGGVLNQWPFYGCVMFGSGESNNLPLITPVTVTDPAVGATVLTLSAPNYATLNPAAGDIIVVAASATFNIGTYSVPQQGQMVRVTAVNAGASQITISAPIEVTQTGSAIWKLTNNGLTTRNAADQDSGIPMWATYKAGVIGGSWTASVADAPFSSSGGCLECSVRIKAFTGGFGLGYLNLWAGATGEVENEYIKNVPIEMSWLAHGNNFRVGRAELTGSGTPSWVIGAHEGARGNRAEIGSVNLGATTPGIGIDINRASRNTLKIGTIVGTAMTYYPINIAAWDFAGATPDTADNVAQIEQDNIASVSSYAAVSGNYRGSTATVAAGGSGYSNGTATQGTAGGSCSVAPTWTITTSAGAITAATINNPGHCNTPPTNPASLSGGSGGTITVSYAGSAAVNNTVRYGVHHGAVTSGAGWQIFAAGAGNWIEGWGDNGTVYHDTPVSPLSSGYRNLRDTTGYRLATGTPILPSGTLISGLSAPSQGADLVLTNSGSLTGSVRVKNNYANFQLLQDDGLTGFRAVLNADGKLYLQSTTDGYATVNVTRLVLGSANGVIGVGGTTSASPALKPSGAILQARLADDSAFAFLQGKLKTDTNYAAGATAATGYITLYDATGTAYKVNACLASGC